VHPPDREHVRRIPAADVDDVLGEQEVADVAPRPAEEREMGRLRALAERLVEVDDVAGRVSLRGREEADTRAVAAGQAQDEVVEPRVVVGREPAPSERHDLPLHRGSIAASAGTTLAE
jgi:hypothetical protein